MAEISLPNRNEIDQKYKWNAEWVFPDVAAWDVEAAKLAEDAGKFKRFQGRLSEGPEVIAEAMAEMQELLRRALVLGSWAGMAYAVDTTDADAGKRDSRSNGLYGQVAAAVALVEPELLALGADALRELPEHEKLGYLTQYVDNLLRRQAHIRSAEVEELLGLVAAPFSNLGHTFSMMTDADFLFPPAVTADGEKLPVSSANLPGV
jgi:oligoendopeptidase F